MSKSIAGIRTSAKMWDRYIQDNSETIDDSRFKFPIDDFGAVELELEDPRFKKQLVIFIEV